MTPIHQLRHFATRSAAAALLIAVGSSVALTAQEPAESKRDQGSDEPAIYTTTSRLIGATVFLKPSAKEVAEAGEAGEQADRPEAKVTEWLVDCRTGELPHAVVSFGGFLGLGDKTVLVAAKELSWNNAMERYDLGWTVEQLKAKPAFDLSAACKTGLDAACGITATDSKKAKDAKQDERGKKSTTEASMSRPSMIDGTQFLRATTCLCKASELASLPVYAGPSEWGTVQDLIVDRKQQRIVLAIVNHGSTLGAGGDDYLLAYPTLNMAMNKEEKLLCAEKATAETLAGSVKFEAPKNGVVDPAAAKKALAKSDAKSDTKHAKERN